MDTQIPTQQPILSPATPSTPLQNPLTPIPASPSGIKSKKFLLIAIFLLLLVVMGGGFFFLNTNNKSSTNLSTAPTLPPISTSPTIVASPTTTQTSDVVKLSNAWSLGTKTYTNPTLGITFDYPSYFEIKEVDVEKENKNWADTYKNDPNAKQPLYKSSFYTMVRSHNPEMPVSREICDNKMEVSVQEYQNPQNMSLYDFIAELNKTYTVHGGTITFDDYKERLVQSQLPKANSYTYNGTNKEVYFANKDKVYEFILSGNCDTGTPIPKDAEPVQNNMLKSVKFL